MNSWTETEEQHFNAIMEAGRFERLSAIRLYRRFNGNFARALQIAKTEYGLSEAQIIAYERNNAIRIASLVKARSAKRLKGSNSTDRTAA